MCDQGFNAHIDQISGYLRPGNTVVVTELSRIARPLDRLLEMMADFAQYEIALVSLREHIDTITATGRCFLRLSTSEPLPRWPSTG